jgi:epoxyqueuosine reductase QueG
LRIISARMDYRPDAADSQGILENGSMAFVARYALGRDYHKVLRARLQRLAKKITGEIGEFGYRVFTDSAPVMEVELARKAGLGWRGKHTLLIAREAGSFFFLGDIYTDLPLPLDAPVDEHCGSCTKCLDVCPTHAIVAPYVVDARRCISYLTIELKGSIPVELRPLIGNRVFGCDECQLVCPWNRYAQLAPEADFQVRNGLTGPSLSTFRVDRKRISTAHVRQRDPPDRLRTLVAQSRRRTRQCPGSERVLARCVRACRILRRSCASTLHGRSNVTARSLCYNASCCHLPCQPIYRHRLKFLRPGPRAEGEYSFAEFC